MASRSSDLSGVGGVGIGCGIVLAILSAVELFKFQNKFG
jgi:hypothetical protein